MKNKSSKNNNNKKGQSALKWTGITNVSRHSVFAGPCEENQQSPYYYFPQNGQQGVIRWQNSQQQPVNMAELYGPGISVSGDSKLTQHGSIDTCCISKNIIGLYSNFVCGHM